MDFDLDCLKSVSTFFHQKISTRSSVPCMVKKWNAPFVMQILTLFHEITEKTKMSVSPFDTGKDFQRLFHFFYVIILVRPIRLIQRIL